MALIRLDQITWGDRLRDIDGEAVQQIKTSIQEEGQLVPILVRKLRGGKFKGVAGKHRFTAMAELGETLIDAKEMKDEKDQVLNDCADVMAEIDENLLRNDLTPKEEGDHWRLREKTHMRRGDRTRVRTAEAAERNAETEKEKLNARKLKEKASRNQKAQEPAENGSNKTRNRKGVQDAMQEAVQLTGRKERTIQQLKRQSKVASEVAEKAGVDPKKIARSSIDTKEELTSLNRLAKANPMTAQRVVKQAADGKDVSATKALKKLKAKQAQEEKERALETEKGVYRELASFLAPAIMNVGKALELGTEKMVHRQLLEELQRVHHTLQLHCEGCKRKAESSNLRVSTGCRKPPLGRT